MAMGRTPPSFLDRPIKVAPKKKGRANVGTFPATTRLMKLVKESMSSDSSSPPTFINTFFKCWGRRPSGPPADPVGKEQMAFRTTEGAISRGSSGA